MIELIFVIVIIGILAVIAITKLTLTRDTAKAVVELNNITNCIEDMASSYTSQHKENINTAACQDVRCAIIDPGNLYDGNITITLKDSSNGYPNYCDTVKENAIKRKLNGVQSFSGTRIKLE